MFSKGKREAEAVPVAAPKPPRAGRAAPSIVSADVVIVGNITSGGDIQVDGTVEGDIRSMSLSVGEKATINGEIIADDVIVRGRVIGSIHARRVQLCSSCHVEGNILHEALAVETGAYFEGNCRHSADPLGEEARSHGNGILGSDPKKISAPGKSGGILGSLGNRGSLADAAGKDADADQHDPA